MQCFICSALHAVITVHNAVMYSVQCAERMRLAKSNSKIDIVNLQFLFSPF